MLDQNNAQQLTVRRVMKSLLFVVSMVLAAPALAQPPMSFSATTYTDCSDVGPGLNCFGYTYAPSGTYIVHDYTTTTVLTAPDGTRIENVGSGSGSSPATSYVTYNVTLDSPDGDYLISSRHEAHCPSINRIFLSTASALSALGKTSEVWYGDYSGSDINIWTEPNIKNCYYNKCGMPSDDICWPSRDSTGVVGVIPTTAPCPAGYRDKFKKILFCFHIEHVEYPTWNPCSGTPPPSWPPWY
jgi:hypothetical protein